MTTIEFDQDYAVQQLRRSRHPLRRLIKYFYLGNILRDVCGPTIDFGCGAGQLLARLPTGSIGLEVNSYLVEELQKIGLNVMFYNSEKDQLSLRELPENFYKTLVMAHVLEHFDNAAFVLRQICRSGNRLGIKRLIFVLPGAKGYRSDITHKTFVNQCYLEKNNLLQCEGFNVSKIDYFPLNVRSIGNYFVFHELKVVYERIE